MDRRWLFLGTLPFVFAAGCRACASTDRADGTAAPARGPEGDTEAGTSASAVEDEVAAGDATPRLSRLRDGAALAGKVLELFDGGASACTGDALAFEKVVVDPACAVSSTAARLLLRDGADAAAPVLRQEASLEADGRVAIALVNGGHTVLTLPLSWHPRIPAFSVLAEDATHAIFELEAPSLDVGARDAGSDGARFAKVVLSPGGRATARITIDRRVVRRLDRPCADGGVADAANACPPRLPVGRYVLHVGQLVCDVDAGAPASLAWEAR